MAAFSVKVDAFDGPLDLLLHLIGKHEVDIFDIPITIITDQFLLYVRTFDDSDMETLSGFLVMAATLLNIKAAMLLPKTVENTKEEAVDPRAELVARLLDYKQYKERAEVLGEREKVGIHASYRDRDGSIDWTAASLFFVNQPLTGVVSVERLRAIFEEILTRRERRTDKIRADFGDITVERFTVNDRMIYIIERIKHGRQISFYALFDGSTTKEEMVVTFLALLELIKQNHVSVVQDGLFNDVYIQR